VAGMLGTIQAAEALKYLLSIGTLATNKFVSFDVKNMRFQEFKVAKNPKCRVCSEGATIKLGGYEQAICDIKKD
ncbi:MAG: adenylyltransferase, partial [Campylobacterales bacterium]|nr:adenylyltransferase [Campylobacterales bacterium]